MNQFGYRSGAEFRDVIGMRLDGGEYLAFMGTGYVIQYEKRRK